MLFQVNVEDFWIDEENISKALERNITNAVVTKIKATIQEQVDKELGPKIEEACLAAVIPAIDKYIHKFITKEGKPVVIKKPRYASTDEPEIIPFEDYLRDMFTANTNWNPTREIKGFAEKFGKDLKLQYNAAFANQIVSNMKEQGFLKDEVTQILLGGKSK